MIRSIDLADSTSVIFVSDSDNLDDFDSEEDLDDDIDI